MMADLRPSGAWLSPSPTRSRNPRTTHRWP